MTAPRVLVVEDEALVLLDMADALQLAGCSVVAAGSVKEALARLSEESFDVAVLDHSLRGEAATAITDVLGQLGTPYIACSGRLAEDKDEFWADAAACVSKPCDSETLVETVQAVAA
jgi:CheY-like chemotaxis protein